MAKDINIHLKTKGTQQVKQELNQTGQAAAKVGDSAEKGGRKGSEGIGKLSDSAKSANSNFSDFKGTMSDWLGSMAGVAVIIAGITKAINAQNQAMDEHARIAAEQQKNLLNLQYLGDLFKEKPELRKEVAALAESAGRPFEEVARTWYTIRSQGGTLTSGQRQSILKEVAELGRTEPNADLESLAKAFLLYTKSTKAKDANLVQNILKQTLTEAGTDITGMGEFLPRFLPVALQAGLTGPEASGLWAFATGQLGSPAEATTGLKAAFLALQGKGTPESQELLKRLGVTPQMGFFEKIKTLSAQQEKGRFGAAEAQTLAGETGIVILR